MQIRGSTILDEILLGSRIRQARERLNMSQAELAKAVKRDQRAISQYERGDRKLAAVDLPRFAEVLDVPIVFFFEGEVAFEQIDKLIAKELQSLPTQEARETLVRLIQLYSQSIRQHTE